jgi:hypothetical protein
MEETVANQILDVVKACPECSLEELTLRLRELHWSEVFYEVERLSRCGQLRLTQSSLGWTTTISVL